MLPRIVTGPLGLLLGTLYPAYASYKAVRTKDVKEYVKWMMYWIVFAFFTTIESVADIFIGFWCPFYYELKIIFLLWLISPVSRGSLGSSMLYRKLVHPNLMKREEEIDHMINRLQDQSYNAAIRFGTQAIQYVTNFVMQAAIQAPAYIAGLAAVARPDQPDYGIPIPMMDPHRGASRQRIQLERQALQKSSLRVDDNEAMEVQEYESFEQSEETSLGQEIEDVIESPVRDETDGYRATLSRFSSAEDDEDNAPLRPPREKSKSSSPSEPKATSSKVKRKKKKPHSKLSFSSDSEKEMEVPSNLALSTSASSEEVHDTDPNFDPEVTLALPRRAGRAAKTKAKLAITEASHEILGGRK